MRLNISALFFLFIFACCTSNNLRPKVYTTLHCDQKFQAVNLIDLIDSASIYNGRWIETSGYYLWASEESVLSLRKTDYQTENMLWVDFESELAYRTVGDSIFLFKSLNEFENVKGKKIRIRGRLDASNNGHRYVAFIYNVCYLEILK